MASPDASQGEGIDMASIQNHKVIQKVFPSNRCTLNKKKSAPKAE